MTPVLVLSGILRLSDHGTPRTMGRFNELIRDNAQVFRNHFGVELFPGSLNVDIQEPSSLQRDLDAGRPTPSIIISKAELINMPAYIGNGQAWPCDLKGAKFLELVQCWIFRRIGSRVPRGVIEIVAEKGLRDAYDLQHGDRVSIEVFSTEKRP